MVAGADDGERATGSSPTDRQIPRTDTGRLPSRGATALNDQRNRPVFISSLTYTRARGGRRRALADGRTMVAGADDGERATGSSPTDRQIPRTDTGRLSSRAHATALNDQRNRPVFISSLTYTRARGGRRRALADGRTMVAGADDGERATGSSPTDRQIPRTDTGRLSCARATALNDQRNRPVFISSLTYTRARGGRRRALADGRTMVAGADDGERATGSSPTDRQIPRTDTGRLSSRAHATALNDQRNRPVFISSLTYTRARGGRRRALADGRTMVAGADDGERATGSSPTDRQIPRTDTGRLSSRATLRL